MLQVLEGSEGKGGGIRRVQGFTLLWENVVQASPGICICICVCFSMCVFLSVAAAAFLSLFFCIDMYHNCNSCNIKITSWNVRGLQKMTKLKQVMSRIRHLKYINTFFFFFTRNSLDNCILKARTEQMAWPSNICML